MNATTVRISQTARCRNGHTACLNPRCYLPDGGTRHDLRARWTDGGIAVEDAAGQPVRVQFGGTADLRTVSAHVPGLGFIGGWRYPHKREAWKFLVDCINEGRLYHDLSDLPNGRRRPTA